MPSAGITKAWCVPYVDQQSTPGSIVLMPPRKLNIWKKQQQKGVGIMKKVKNTIRTMKNKTKIAVVEMRMMLAIKDRRVIEDNVQ